MKPFLVKLSFFVLSLVVISHVVVWFYEAPKRKAIVNKTLDVQNKWNDIKDPDQAYDIIIIGSSRGDSAYHPGVLNSITGLTAYNMCSGSQEIAESYYIVKEIVKYQKPAFLVVDHFLPSFKNNPDYYHLLANAEQMSLEGRTELVFNGFGAEGVWNYALPIVKYKSYFKNDIKNSFSDQKRATSYTRINGFYRDETKVDSIDIAGFKPMETILPAADNRQRAQKYIDKLIALCQKNNIRLIPSRAPYPPSRMRSFHEDKAQLYFKNLYRSYNIEFLDFNYPPPPALEDTDFSDNRHLNVYGAEKVSEILAEYIVKQPLK